MRITTRSRSRTARTFVATMLAATLAAACGGSDAPTGPPPEVVARIDVSAATTTIAPQQTVRLEAVVKSSTGSTIGTVEPVWSSSANAIATVNPEGIVTGVAPGTATIRAASGTVAGTLTVTVTSGIGVLVTIAVDVDDRTIELGSVTQATVSGRDAQGNAVALGNRQVTWSTSNASIATISNAGVASGVGVGLVDLQVSVADGALPKTASVQLIVSGIPGAPTSARVDMLPQDFLPFETVIKQNGTVSFVFPSLDHNVIWDRRLGAPADINTTRDATVSRTFPTVGVFQVCVYAPSGDGGENCCVALEW